MPARSVARGFPETASCLSKVTREDTRLATGTALSPRLAAMCIKTRSATEVAIVRHLLPQLAPDGLLIPALFTRVHVYGEHFLNEYDWWCV